MILLSLVFLFSSTLTLDLPSYFPKCCLQDPQISQCISDAAKTVKPFIQQGIKEIGIQSFYPIVIQKYKIDFSGGAGTFVNHGTNFTFYGLNDYQIDNLQFDLKNMSLKGKLIFKEVFSLSYYSVVNGHMADVPVSGNGIFGGMVGPLNISFEIRGRLVKTNGVDYVNTESVKLYFKVSNYPVWFEGLSYENGPWGNTNDLLMKNGKLIGSGTEDALNAIFEQHLTKYLDWFLYEMPLNNLFPC